MLLCASAQPLSSLPAMSSNRGAESSSRVTSSTQRQDDVSWGDDNAATHIAEDAPATAADDDALQTVAMPAAAHPTIEDDASPVQVLPLPAAVAASSAHIFSSTIAPSASSAAPADDYACPDMPVAKSPTFVNFRAHVQKRKIAVGKQLWTYYDLGPRNDPAVPPLICIPGTSGTAESFFEQVMSLGNRGYRVISVNPPAYFSMDEWCNGFNGFLYAMGLTNTAAAAGQAQSQSNSPTAAAAAASSSAADGSVVPATGRVHVLATSLSGYLCLYYLSHILPAKNFIASLILCNAFLDTQAYQSAHGGGGSSTGGGASSWCLALLKRAPDFVLKKFVLDSMPQHTAFPHVVDFTIDQLDTNLPSDVLASRLTLNIVKSRGVSKPHLWRDRSGRPFEQRNITILDTTDESTIPDATRERLYTALPDARYALLKRGGDLPFLSVPAEVNMHIIVHLRAQGINPGIKDAAPAAAAGDEGEGDLPPVIRLSSLPGAATPKSSAAAASLHFLTPSRRPLPILSSGSHLDGVASGSGGRYGHEDDEEGNESIFLSKNTPQPGLSAAAAAAMAAQPAAPAATSVQLGSPDSTRSAELRAEMERTELLRSIQAEESARSARAAALAAEREAREAESAAAERARLDEESAKAERQKHMLDELFDSEEAAAVEQRLTMKKEVTIRNTDDLF